MKTFFIYLLIIVVGQSAFSQDTICNPNLKEIYNFNIGDVFYYKITKGYYPNDLYYLGGSEWSNKCTIIDKVVEADTLKYFRYGISHYYEYLLSNQIVKFRWEVSSNEFQDTLIIIDSINHFLNACNGDTVNILYDKIFDNDTVSFKSVEDFQVLAIWK